MPWKKDVSSRRCDSRPNPPNRLPGSRQLSSAALPPVQARQ